MTMMRKTTCVVWLCVLGLLVVQANAAFQSSSCFYDNHPQSIVKTLAGDSDLSTFAAMLNASGLNEVIDESYYTVFAPTNHAFEQFYYDFGLASDDLMANKDILISGVEFHIHSGIFNYANFTSGEELSTLLSDETLSVNKVSDNSVNITADESWASIIRGNVWACNGVVHIIDYVLVPESALEQYEDGVDRK